MRFYLRDEVVIHNQIDDIWVIINRIVYNLTELIKDRLDSLNASLRLLIAYAGKDLSHFFEENNTPKTLLSKTGTVIPRFGAAIENATSQMEHNVECYWWSDPTYMIGKITAKERKIRLINALTATVQSMTVCEEDTIYQIMEKYNERYNYHAGSYTWRKDITRDDSISGKLEFNRTLTENGIFDEAGPAPSLWLFYNDDFTIA